MNKSIWIFAEERTGSTWLATTLSRKLRLNYVYVEENKEDLPDEEWIETVSNSDFYKEKRIYHTHKFSILNTDVVKNSIVIKTDRRDTFEQLLSFLFMNNTRGTDWWNAPHFQSKPLETFLQRKEEFLDFVKNRKIKITKEEVDAFKRKKLTRNEMWKSFDCEKFLVYYEDLYTGIYIPGIEGVLTFNDTHGVFIKLPYNKNDLIMNIDDVKVWLYT